MNLLDKAHLQLMDYNWNDYFIYDESSPTCLMWKDEFRKSKGSSVTRRKSMIVGGFKQKTFAIVMFNKLPRSIAKIIWVMHNGAIPIGYSVFFKDDDLTNCKLSNLFIKETGIDLPEKYCKNIRDYLVYDTNSPSFLTWKKRSSVGSKIKAGDVAGSLDIQDDYWKLHALGYSYKVHRVIWYLHHGKIPEKYTIDHIDRNRQNNNISNLRCVPSSINGKNRTINENNKTGINGIAYSEFYNHRGTLIKRYVVCLTANRKRYSKSFSIIKYGNEIAWDKAIEYKMQLVKMFTEMNVGFTEDHGT